MKLMRHILLHCNTLTFTTVFYHIVLFSESQDGFDLKMLTFACVMVLQEIGYVISTKPTILVVQYHEYERSLQGPFA